MIRRGDLIQKPTTTGWAASWGNPHFADCAEDETHSTGLAVLMFLNKDQSI